MSEGSPLERLGNALADRYLVEREIGSGGTATVYLAQDLKHHRPVAIKVLSPDLAAAIGAERFLREIEIAANLNHPHILPLFDSGQADDVLFYVMPYVEGESLRARLEREEQLPVDDAVQITREIADALAFAHEHGVLHRDVKPGNILLEAGHAVLADFGIAGAVAGADETRLTRTGVSLGTPAYMSPEQATGEQDLDGRSDQYALACVLYEMLAGRPPFSGRTVASVVGQHVAAEATPVGQVRPSVPKSVAGALDRALAKTPADRFRTTAEFQRALAVPHTSTGAGRKIRWKPTAIGAGLAAAAVAAVALAASMLGPSEVHREGDDRPGIAVLPCANMSTDPSDAYLAAALHDEILLQLQKISSLFSIGRTSVLRYIEEPPPVDQIASRLGVGFIGECSVQKHGEQIRLIFQLLDGATGGQIWADDFDRRLSPTNLLAIQSEIAREIAFALQVEIAPEEQARIETIPTESEEAYVAYLRGLQYLGLKPVPLSDQLQRAEALFSEAVQADPRFVAAFRQLARTHSLFYWYGYDPSPTRLRQALSAAESAADLAPESIDALLAMGEVLVRARDAEPGMQYLNRAEMISGGSAELFFLKSYALRIEGSWASALDNLLRAKILDPQNSAIPFHLGTTYHRLRRYTLAEEYFREVLELSPNDNQSLGWLSNIPLYRDGDLVAWRERRVQNGLNIGWYQLLLEGNYSEALKVVDEGPEVYLSARDFEPRAQRKGLILLAAGDTANARLEFEAARDFLEPALDSLPNDGRKYRSLGVTLAGLQQREAAIRAGERAVELRGSAIDGIWGPRFEYDLVRTYAAVGAYEEAIGLLRSYLGRPHMYTLRALLLDPRLAPLRGHPEIPALERLEQEAADRILAEVPNG